ncbi:MAG: hypothetical protein FWE76_05410 [Symbiobacteriaceae bacterium]|nr:hypothetical protein [Symbiobacteriaceae bacterium]
MPKITVTGDAGLIEICKAYLTLRKLHNPEIESLVEFVIEEEPSPWRADIGHVFWCVDPTGMVSTFEEHGSTFAQNAWEAGNYYQTEAEAEAAAERVRKAYFGAET